MKRKTFLKHSSLTAFSIMAFGSIKWNGSRFTGDSPTTTDILGPFYRPGAPMRNNIVPSDSKGQALKLSGTVFKADGKSTLANTLVEIWQCDENEAYDNTSDDYRFRGAVRTGPDGKYRFSTIIPVPYEAAPKLWRPAHIHFRVSHPDHQDLITQIYFKGDPHLEKDLGSASPAAQSRILEIGKGKDGVQQVQFNIVMRKEFDLDDQAYKKITGIYEMKDGMAEFYREDDLLMMKINGQIREALTYKGDNTFEGGLGLVKAKFTLTQKGASVEISTGAFDEGDLSKVTVNKGEKILKYGG